MAIGEITVSLRSRPSRRGANFMIPAFTKRELWVLAPPEPNQSSCRADTWIGSEIIYTDHGGRDSPRPIMAEAHGGHHDKLGLFDEIEMSERR